MEHFFLDDRFMSSIEDLIEHLEIDEESANELPENWEEKVELSELEPIFKIDADTLCQLLADANEDRLTEEFGEESKVLNALKESIDFEKLNSLLPKLYYPSGKFEKITKSDILDYFN